MQITTIPLGPLETNCYFVTKGAEAIVIDPGGDPAPVLELLTKSKCKLTHIFNTHLHLDHTYGNAALSRATGIPIHAGEGEAEIESTELVRGGLFGLPEVEPYEWQIIAPGKHQVLGQDCLVLHTPGHSPGSIVFYFAKDKTAFVGDLIFKGSVGRTDFPGGSMNKLLDSIRNKIFTLPEETALYSGHGPVTTVKREIQSNPYV